MLEREFHEGPAGWVVLCVLLESAWHTPFSSALLNTYHTGSTSVGMGLVTRNTYMENRPPQGLVFLA